MRLSSSLGWFITPAIFTLHFVPGKIYSLAIVGSGPANFPAFAISSEMIQGGPLPVVNHCGVTQFCLGSPTNPTHTIHILYIYIYTVYYLYIYLQKIKHSCRWIYHSHGWYGQDHSTILNFSLFERPWRCIPEGTKRGGGDRWGNGAAWRMMVMSLVLQSYLFRRYIFRDFYPRNLPKIPSQKVLMSTTHTIHVWFIYLHLP